MQQKYLFLLLGLIIAIAFSPSLLGYFQHDEWSTFGTLILTQRDGFLSILNYLFWPDVAHYTPITRIIFLLEFIFFKLNFSGYIVLSLLLHFIVTYLVYVLTRQLLKDKKFSIYVALVFVISLAGYQAVTWVGASVVTLVSAIFALSSFIFFLKRSFKTSFLFWFLSMFSKETAIALPVVFIIYNVFFEKNFFKNLRLHLITPLIPLVLYILLRLSFFLFPNPGGTNFIATQTQSITDIIYNLLSFPVKIFSQAIIPQRTLLSIANYLADMLGITSQTIVETTLSEILSVLIFIFCLLVLYYLRKRVDKKYLKIAIFGILFVILNSFIYAFSPGRVGVITLIDSRNLYFPMIGVILFLGSIIFGLYKQNKKILYWSTVLLILLNTPIIFVDFIKIAQEGSQRRAIVSKIIKENPQIPQKAIFYIESDKAYYGMPETEKIPPFETGLGQILLISYAQKYDFPNSFFEENFLYGILDEGYKEDGGIGFGYFRNYDKLMLETKQNKLPPKSIFSYTWNSQTRELK